MSSKILFTIILLFSAAVAQAREASEVRPALIPPGGLPLFFSSAGPLSYRSLTHSEIPKDAIPLGEMRGQSCQFSLSVPLTASFHSTSISGAVGNGTFNKIIDQMQKDHPGLRGIYDVKVDLHTTTVLGVFGKLCTEINAQGYR